jgi:tripartite-type tricarboxylate transporter receptor subunit TctC
MMIRAVLAAVLALCATPPAAAQEWPAKPVRIVVPFSPGGVADNSARVIADKLGARLGQQVIVENRAGASGNIGTEAVAKAAPDGYTLLLGFDGTMVINPHVFAKLPFDTLRDFQPVTKLGDATLILVAHPSLPANSLPELIAYSKAQPGGVAYGTSGTGGTPHLAGELLVQRSGAKLVHVPYKGGGQAITDLVGGQVPIGSLGNTPLLPHHRAGRVKILAQTTAARSASLPDVPTYQEAGMRGLVLEQWLALFVAAGTAAEVKARLAAEVSKALAEPAVRERYAQMGLEPVGGTPEDLARQYRVDYEKYGRLIKELGIRPE